MYDDMPATIEEWEDTFGEVRFRPSTDICAEDGREWTVEIVITRPDGIEARDYLDIDVLLDRVLDVRRAINSMGYPQWIKDDRRWMTDDGRYYHVRAVELDDDEWQFDAVVTVMDPDMGVECEKIVRVSENMPRRDFVRLMDMAPVYEENGHTPVWKTKGMKTDTYFDEKV